MGDRATKLRRLNEFRRRLPHCSASALAAIIADVKENGMPDGPTDRDAFRIAKDLQNAALTPYGPVLQALVVYGKDDKEQELSYANPFALLWTASAECNSFSAFFLQKLKDKPPSIEEPWQLVLYSDEVTPCNPLGNMNKRKFHGIYWSFLEFGLNALSREEAWFCLATEYSVLVNLLSAGLSQVIAALMMVFFSAERINICSDWCTG